MSEYFDVVVIGAGHAGLAASHFLSERSIDHVVLERGEVANSWRRERWDSLRLLTPNWQSQLPGLPYAGPDPDGYMTVPEVTELVERFAKLSGAPRPHGHHRDVGQARCWRVPRHDEPRRDPLPGAGHRDRCLQPAGGAGAGGGGPGRR